MGGDNSRNYIRNHLPATASASEPHVKEASLSCRHVYN